jgi:Cu/Ag efflux protein CusF
MNRPLLIQIIQTGCFRKLLALVFGACLLVGCSSKQAPSGPVRKFPVTGKVLAVNSKNQTATIDTAAIPNYMEAMTMEYPVQSRSDFESLRAGDQITGTLIVRADDSYTLTDLRKQQNGK